MASGIPYWIRVATLLLLMLIFAAIDLLRRGKTSTRWKEYAVILVAGMAGGIFGLVNDLITSSISEDYFTLGKGLVSHNIHAAAAILGFEAGFSAGVIGASLCVYFATRISRSPALPVWPILLLTWRPVVLAVVCGTLFPILCGHLDPFNFADSLNGAVLPAGITRFVHVWWIHMGLYTGLASGVVWMISVIARFRRQVATST